MMYCLGITVSIYLPSVVQSQMLGTAENYEPSPQIFNQQPHPYGSCQGVPHNFGNQTLPQGITFQQPGDGAQLNIHGVTQTDQSQIPQHPFQHPKQRMQKQPNIGHVTNPSVSDEVAAINNNEDSSQEGTNIVAPQGHSNTSSSFPHLDMEKLNDQDRLTLQQKLLKDSDDIISEFGDLIHHTITSTASRISVTKLRTRLSSLGSYRPTRNPVPLLRNHLDKIEKAGDVDEVFCVLDAYYSFFNYGVIEKIIGWFGTPKDKERLEAYTEHFKRFCKRRTFECPSHVFGHAVDKGKSNLVVKVEESWDPTDGCSLESVLRLRNSLSEILEVESETLYLLQIDKGCVELLFQVPSFVEEDIFPLSMEQERSLASTGVSKLTCGGYSYFQSPEV